ncbi:MAG TPA: hypothetical protein VD997_13260 [Phycisphaerales bacterium]|nr:hypothetical protein [Phycisphaerales bacterium]
MSDAAGTIGVLLAGLRRRQRGLNALRWGVDGLLVGGGLACVVALAMWLGGITEIPRVVTVAALVMGAGVLVGAAAGMLRPISDLALARALDAAGKSQDRFASALQLVNDPHKERAALVLEDAIAHVRGTAPAAALPVRVPRTARWAPVPALVLLVMLLVLPQPKLQAADAVTPEISPDEWAQISDEFKKDLEKLEKPLTPEDEELQRELEKLAEKLKENPDKKDALKDIARLSEKVEKERKAISAKELALKKAAKAMTRSEALKQFAAKMQAGEYQGASEELKATAGKMSEDQMALDAEEMEAMAQDLQELAEQLDADKELQSECQNAASAASKMNKKELSEALKRLSEQMKKNAGKYQKSDRLSKQKSMLDELKRRMNQGKCQGCEDGCEECEGGFCDKPGDKPGKRAGRGGLKAGWGSMAKWDGGKLNKGDEKRTPELTDLMEQQGESATFKVVSPDEKARSGKRYEEMYAEFVQKAEADLDLESMPVSQREYLKRYFKAIRPQEPEEKGSEEKSSESTGEEKPAE